jgi:hypothetical protein
MADFFFIQPLFRSLFPPSLFTSLLLYNLFIKWLAELSLLVVVVVTRSRLVSSLDLTSLLSSLSREFILLGFRVKLIHSSLFFLWGFAYGLLDVLNKKFQTVLGVTKLESTGLQVMYFGVGYLL